MSIIASESKGNGAAKKECVQCNFAELHTLPKEHEINYIQNDSITESQIVWVQKGQQPGIIRSQCHLVKAVWFILKQVCTNTKDYVPPQSLLII